MQAFPSVKGSQGISKPGAGPDSAGARLLTVQAHALDEHAPALQGPFHVLTPGDQGGGTEESDAVFGPESGAGASLVRIR